MKNAVLDIRSDVNRRVELKGVRSKKGLLEALAVGLKLPRHFGHNWDALADCLMDSDWAKHSGITIVICDAANAEKRFGDDWATMISIFEEACIWWDENDKAFQVAIT